MDNVMNANKWKLHALTQKLDHRINLLSRTEPVTSPSWTDILILSWNPSWGWAVLHAHATPFEWNSVPNSPWPWQPTFHLTNVMSIDSKPWISHIAKHSAYHLSIQSSQHRRGQMLVTLLEFTDKTMETQKGSITFCHRLINVGVWVGMLNSLVLNPKLLTITYPAPG